MPTNILIFFHDSYYPLLANHKVMIFQILLAFLARLTQIFFNSLTGKLSVELPFSFPLRNLIRLVYIQRN